MGVSDALVNTAATLGVIAGIIGSVGVIAKSTRLGRPLRWLIRRNIVEPLGKWCRDQITTVVRDVLMKPNGGHSLADVAGEVRDIKRHLNLPVREDVER